MQDAGLALAITIVLIAETAGLGVLALLMLALAGGLIGSSVAGRVRRRRRAGGRRRARSCTPGQPWSVVVMEERAVGGPGGEVRDQDDRQDEPADERADQRDRASGVAGLVAGDAGAVAAGGAQSSGHPGQVAEDVQRA